jgi:hypothetical protein
MMMVIFQSKEVQPPKKRDIVNKEYLKTNMYPLMLKCLMNFRMQWIAMTKESS